MNERMPNGRSFDSISHVVFVFIALKIPQIIIFHRNENSFKPILDMAYFWGHLKH